MKKIMCFIIFLFACLSMHGQDSADIKEAKLSVQSMPKALIDFENTNKNDILVIRYKSYSRGDYEIITDADFYYVCDDSESFMGRFSTKHGFRNAADKLIYQPSEWFGGCEVLGISKSFLQDPTIPAGIAIDRNGDLYESEIMFRLGFNFKERTIYEWFPKWD